MVRILIHEFVLAALPNSEIDAKSLKQIAGALGLETSNMPIGSEQSAVSQES